MEQTITAIYTRGVLRPLQTLDLPEREPIQLKIVRREKQSRQPRNHSEYARALCVLRQNGLVKPKRARARRRVSQRRRRALTRALSVGKSLSQIVIEDRDSTH